MPITLRGLGLMVVGSYEIRAINVCVNIFHIKNFQHNPFSKVFCFKLIYKYLKDKNGFSIWLKVGGSGSRNYFSKNPNPFASLDQTR